jgi:hypothetical protein
MSNEKSDVNNMSRTHHIRFASIFFFVHS